MPLDWYPTAEKTETTKKYDGNQGRRAVVIHIAEGSYAAAVRWLSDTQLNPNSSAHFIVAKDGRVAQLMSVNDGAWANGLRWVADASQPNGGYWTNPRGIRNNPTWKDLLPGVSPNQYTISIEHEGFYQETWTPEMYTANNELLAWIADQFDLIWVPYRNLIGHYAIDPVDRANCPGPTVNLEKMAADANATRLLKMVVPQASNVHIYGTTALLQLPTRQIITQLRDTNTAVYGYLDFAGKRWYITPYSVENKLAHFFDAAATSPTAPLFPSLSLNPGFRDSVVPSADELRALKPRWLRVLLFDQYQNDSTGQNTELDWLLERVRNTYANIKILALINPETLGEIPPATGSANWNTYIERASNLARQIASFYSGKIDALEIWNEPDVQNILPENYAALLQAAYQKVKAVNPSLPVISAGICCGESFDYLRRVVAVAPDAFDYAGWHIYAERADGFPFPNWGFGEIRNSINTARAIAGKPLWITELGAQLDFDWGNLPPPQAVAYYLKRVYAIMSEVGRNQVAEAFWFTWRIADESWGMVDDAGNKRPAWFALEQLAQGAPPSPPPAGQVEISNVSFSPLALDARQLLNVSLTVRNGTNAAIPTQAPAPGLVYNEGESFVSRGYGEVNGAWRVGIDFGGRSGIDYPYRWGFGSSIAPGESRTIYGSIRLNKTESKDYWAGLVQEHLAWRQDNIGRTNITVRPVVQPPPTGKPTVLAVQFSPTTLDSGQLLNVSITVRNDTNVPLSTQSPNPGFTYLEGESFLSHGLIEQRDAFRLGVDFEGRTGVDHPYRWGFGSPLAPGETRVINGVMRVSRVQTKNYWVGLVREQVEWLEDRQGEQAITVRSVGSPPPPPPTGKPVITAIQFIPSFMEQGNIMQAKVTVRNDSSRSLVTQGPELGLLYNEGDNYLTKGHPPTLGAWRVGVDYDGRQGVAYPYRWGLGSTLAPGQSTVVSGFIRLNKRQNSFFFAGLIQEENNVVVDRAGVTNVIVKRP